MSKPNSFTLIELVIVIAVLAILSAVVVITINPAEQMRSARDSRRAEELTTINKAISLYVADGGSSLGSTNTVYVSIPDSSATCANLGLPTLPTGWSYRCSTSTNLQKTNGTGWIPINFSNISFTTPLSSLPVDPVNTTSTGNYYTYITGGSWELTSSMESAKYKLGGANDKTSKDGGLYTGLYELGTNLTLLPLDYGDTSLVGYWKFDEGTGTIAYDASGKGKNGTFSSSAPSWTTGKIGNGALSFNGTSNYVNLTNLAVNTASGANNTVSFWMKWDGTGSTAMPFSFSSLYDLMINGSKFGFNTSCSDSFGIPFSSAQYANVWVYITAIFNNNNVSQSQIFLNGIQQVLSQSNTPCNKAATANSLVGAWVGPSYHFPGLIDDVRIYNRALSVTEILALYSATNK